MRNALRHLRSPLPKSISVLYLLAFFLGLMMSLPAYINSSFLDQFIPEKFVGSVFAAAALVTIITFSKLPKILRHLGNFRTTVVVLCILGASTVGLAVSETAFSAIVFFVITEISFVALLFTFDIFLEHLSKDSITGEIRGTYLVCMNAAWVIAQLGSGIIISDSQYWRIFALSSLLVLPMLWYVIRNFKNFSDPHYTELSFIKLLSSARKHKKVINILVINFLLQFFFSWMVIYTPIYLHNYLGFEWKQIAIMFAIMLTPFVIIERPFGKIADQWLGEKELLVAGFIIMAITSGIMSFVTSTNFLLWAALLFVSRIGASAVEVMSETYFFKQVNDSDASQIGLFRTTRPWAYVLAPVTATILLPIVGVQYLFIILSFVMLYGGIRALTLKDTR